MKYLTRQEAADLLNCSPRTVDRWIKLDGLKVIRIGRTVRISDEELNRFLKAPEEGRQ